MDTKLITRQYRLQKRAKLIAERSDCGLTIQAFCRERGISRNAYFYWLNVETGDLIHAKQETENFNPIVKVIYQWRAEVGAYIC